MSDSFISMAANVSSTWPLSISSTSRTSVVASAAGIPSGRTQPWKKIARLSGQIIRPPANSINPSAVGEDPRRRRLVLKIIRPTVSRLGSGTYSSSPPSTQSTWEVPPTVEALPKTYLEGNHVEVASSSSWSSVRRWPTSSSTSSSTWHPLVLPDSSIQDSSARSASPLGGGEGGDGGEGVLRFSTSPESASSSSSWWMTGSNVTSTWASTAAAVVSDDWSGGGDELQGNATICNWTAVAGLNVSDVWSSAGVIGSSSNCSSSSGGTGMDLSEKDYWALLLVLFPLFTFFGNVLVILSVYRERSLQNATNYFIVSLALADLLVAALVMPFAVYVLVNANTWLLPPFLCDFYIAMDVICSTSSIFNLVAISIDRYIAVTQPIKYAKHKNNGRVWLTIILVWAISMAIGLPIVLGLNQTPDRDPTACMFFNPDFVIYSSLSSFYIPCLAMVFLYYKIFKAIRKRAKKATANKRHANHGHLNNTKATSVIDNLAQTKRFAETALGASPILPLSRPHRALLAHDEEEKVTDQGSGSQEDEDDFDRDVDEGDAWEEGAVLPRDNSREFMLKQNENNKSAPNSKLPQIATINGESNGNPDPSYVVSSRQEPNPAHPPPVCALPTHQDVTDLHTSQTLVKPERHIGATASSNTPATPSVDLPNNANCTSGTGSSTNKDEKSGSRFTIYKVNKASRKKREKSSAKRERKATKTLAIVLGVFLMCWLPFFTCSIMDALCTKFDGNCQPGVSVFLLTTWLGYMNSFINPVIYTIFNLEFRKAFKRLLTCAS